MGTFVWLLTFHLYKPRREPEVLPARPEVCLQVPAAKHVGWHHPPLVTPVDIGSLPTPGRGRGRGAGEGAGLQLLVGGREGNIFTSTGPVTESVGASVSHFKKGTITVPMS